MSDTIQSQPCPARVRSAGRALVIRDGCVLVVRYSDAEGHWYLLPGGGQRAGEALPATVERECREEIGAGVHVGELRFVREFIAADYGPSHLPPGFHQVEHIFLCEPADGEEPTDEAEGDTTQTGWAWLPVAELSDRRLFPAALRRLVTPEGLAAAPVYIGDGRE